MLKMNINIEVDNEENVIIEFFREYQEDRDVEGKIKYSSTNWGDAESMLHDLIRKFFENIEG